MRVPIGCRSIGVQLPRHLDTYHPCSAQDFLHPSMARGAASRNEYYTAMPSPVARTRHSRTHDARILHPPSKQRYLAVVRKSQFPEIRSCVHGRQAAKFGHFHDPGPSSLLPFKRERTAFEALFTHHWRPLGMANCLAAQMSSLSVTAQASSSRPATVRPWVPPLHIGR